MCERNHLVEAHLHLARAAARRAARSKFFRERLGDVEDIYQCACLSLLRLAEEFDPGRAVPFDRYAAARLRYRLVDLARGPFGLVHSSGRCKKGGSPPFKVEAMRVEVRVTDSSQEAWERMDDVRTILPRCLTPKQHRVVSLHFGIQGRPHTLAEIAVLEGVTASAVSLRQKTALDELRAYLRRHDGQV